MELKVGEMYFRPDISTDIYLVHTIGEYFILWYKLVPSTGEWSPVLNPESKAHLMLELAKGELMPYNDATRTLYARR